MFPIFLIQTGHLHVVIFFFSSFIGTSFWNGTNRDRKNVEKEIKLANYGRDGNSSETVLNIFRACNKSFIQIMACWRIHNGKILSCFNCCNKKSEMYVKIIDHIMAKHFSNILLVLLECEHWILLECWQAQCYCTIVPS